MNTDVEPLCRLSRRFARLQPPIGEPSELCNAVEAFRVVLSMLPY